MTPLAMLIGGACFVILYRLFGASSVIALALLLLAAALLGNPHSLFPGVLREGHDVRHPSMVAP